MRVIASILILLFASLFTTASLAQAALRECPTVDLLGPADGAVLDPGYRVDFTWDSEPRGTASREWISVKVDLDDASFTFENAKHEAAERGLYKGFARGTPGVYAWAVIFYDAEGNPICQSEARTYFVTGTGFADAPANFQPGGVAVVKVSLGRYVVKFNGSSYAGPFNRELAAGDNDYDDDTDATGQYDWKALGYTGLDVHGNDDDNTIKGSNQDDRLFGYAGNDKIRGRDGDDYIEGGNESCSGDFCNAFNHLGDDIGGGDGSDTILGGDESCSGLLCNFIGSMGDEIDGGDGDDTINGGDESCTGFACNTGNAGDDIDGDTGNDTLNGNDGDDDIEGNDGDDTINGNDGDDDIEGNGGNDTINGNDGDDDIEGNAGNDTLNGNDGNDDIYGGSGSDTIDGGNGFDFADGGPGSDTCSSASTISC